MPDLSDYSLYDVDGDVVVNFPSAKCVKASLDAPGGWICIDEHGNYVSADRVADAERHCQILRYVYAAL